MADFVLADKWNVGVSTPTYELISHLRIDTMLSFLKFALLNCGLLTSISCFSLSISDASMPDASVLFFSKDVIYGQIIGKPIYKLPKSGLCPNYFYRLKIIDTLKYKFKKGDTIEIVLSNGGHNVREGTAQIVFLADERYDPLLKECFEDGVGKYFSNQKTHIALLSPFSTASIDKGKFLFEQCDSLDKIIFDGKFKLSGDIKKINQDGIQCNQLKGSLDELLNLIKFSIENNPSWTEKINVDFFKIKSIEATKLR